MRKGCDRQNAQQGSRSTVANNRKHCSVSHGRRAAVHTERRIRQRKCERQLRSTLKRQERRTVIAG
eukprot:2624927-Amphidinium_carterae.1